ncbi:hypothetical protein EIP91_001721 [Steccherinum ochraceum]|uniref:Cytochrome P450 n=1 Tax=Steccherinum ochraceum TaxID=92696 RepID=A0A4V2MWG0_9APHY|nr:hypothetical protein EIP91_001721 [Steccherinum ochraceum]
MLNFSSVGALEVILLITCIGISYYGYSSSKRGGSPLPPGPKKVPLFGNKLDVPLTFQWLKYSEWHKKYGPMITVNMMGLNIIVISSQKIVQDLLEKRHTQYSERPRFPMITDLVGWDQTTVFMPIDSLWKEHRKNFSRLFGTKTTMAKFFSMEVFEARRFMRNILREKDKLEDHVRYWAGSLSLKIAYGYETKVGHDDLVELVDEAMDQFTFLSKPGRYLVDFFPILKYVPAWVPGATFQRKAAFYRKTLTDMINIPFEMAQKQLKAGTAKPSFTTDLLSADDYNSQKEYALKTSAATIYAGGADTTAGQTHGFILIMMLWPEACKKAQAEIDRVIGPDRLPDYNDRENLPFVEACIKEAMRLHTFVPLGATRIAPKDDVVNGYFIPAGTIIQPHAWQMLHDPDTYPNPFNFIPERWLVENPPPQTREMMFGFGRRMCPGMVLADASVWLAATMFLALFDIKPTDGSPKKFDQGPDGVLDGQNLCHPKPFKSNITPRNAKAEALILSIDHEL